MSSGFTYACGWNKLNFMIMGMWPRTNLVGFRRYHVLLNAFAIFSILTVPRLAALYLFWGEIDAIVQSFSTHMPFAMAIVKLIIIYLHQQALGEFLESMETDWKTPISNEQYVTMMKMARIGRGISIFSGVTVYAANIFGAVVQQPDPRLTVNLFWVVYLPVDTSKGLKFAVAILLQFYTSFLGSLVYLVFDSFVAMTTLHLCGQLGVLQLSFKQLCDRHCVEKPRMFERQLRSIVQRHNELIRLSKTLDNSFNFVLFLSLVGCTLTFCFQGYAILTLLGKGQLNFFQIAFSVTVTMGAISHFFICCWVGDYLITKSSEAGRAYFTNEWYKLPYQQARSLMLIGFKTFSPLELTAGKFAAMSLNLFLNVIKTSMSYLSMLLAVQTRGL